MGWEKIDIEGMVMYQDSVGQRLKEPDKEPDKYGWEQIDVDGRVMWQSPDGERAF